MTILVLRRDDGLVAVSKPPKLLVIPGRAPGQHECLKELVAEQLGVPVWVCHRIDQDTSGVVLFATDAQTHRAVSMAFEQGQVKKRYWALVAGRVAAPLDLQQPLIEGRKRTMRVAFHGEQGKPSRTLVRPLEAFGDAATLVECEPLTGRQHQIRVHLKAAGHPLLFDHQYGRKVALREVDCGGESDEVILDRTPLHAAALSLRLGASTFEVAAPLPPDLERVLTLFRSVQARRALQPHVGA